MSLVSLSPLTFTHMTRSYLHPSLLPGMVTGICGGTDPFCKTKEQRMGFLCRKHPYNNLSPDVSSSLFSGDF